MKGQGTSVPLHIIPEDQLATQVTGYGDILLLLRITGFYFYAERDKQEEVHCQCIQISARILYANTFICFQHSNAEIQTSSTGY